MNKLDVIEERLNKFDVKFNSIAGEVKTERLSALENSAQFLSDIKDEHEAIKFQLKNIKKDVDISSKVKDRLIDVETQNLSNNLLFFAIDEKPVAMDADNAENGGDDIETKQTENCIEVVLDFCEKTLNIEQARENLKIEKAYRLGKRIDGAVRPRPIVVKFSQHSDREKVRKSSGRLKGTNYGISPQYPPEVLANSKKLIPVMIKKT